MFKKINKRFSKIMSLLLVMVLVLPNLPIYAEDSSTVTKENIFPTIINEKDSSVVVDKQEDNFLIKVEMNFHINEITWNEIKELEEPLVMRFPDILVLEKSNNNDLKFVNTDENFKKDTYVGLNDDRLSIEENSIEIDFRNVMEKPEDFRLIYTLTLVDDFELLKAIDKSEFPVVISILEDTLQQIEALLKEDQIQVDELIESEEKIETTNVTDGEETLPKDQTTELNLDVYGNLELKLKGTPKARIKNNDKLINDANPIDMETYSDEADTYTIDLYTDENNTHLGVEYVLTLDEASLALLTEETIQEILDYQYRENNVRVPFTYEYEFPDNVLLHPATGESIAASLILGEYSTSAFERLDPNNPDGKFKLAIKETKIESEEESIETQYKFQEYVSANLNKYIREELESGTPLTEIKEALKNGVVVAVDEFKTDNYLYKQNQKDSFEKLQDYPLSIENVLNSNKNIEDRLPVRPIGGVDHTLIGEGFDQIANGFEIKWSGEANTNRKKEMSTLDLSFDIPKVVKDSGIGNWTIKTTVSVSFYDILNDGTQVKNSKYDDVVFEEENQLTTGVNPISIDLNNDNVAIKYDVTQTFINEDLNIEIEGNQISRLTSKINSNQNILKVENAKEFPRSIIINGVKGQESTPTSLIWHVVYNNNKLIREEGNGFNFYLDKDELKTYRYLGSGDKYSEVPIDFSNLLFKTTVRVDGKSIEEDGRFELIWNEDFTNAEIRLKNGQLEKEVTFEFKYEIDVVNDYADGKSIREELLTSSKLKFEGMANVKSFTNGTEIEPPQEKEEEIIKRKAINYLVLLDKRPIMIDYRTKEVIWGVAINTVTAYRVGLNGLTYADHFKTSGMIFEEMDENNPILMFKVDSKKVPHTSHGEYSKFLAKIKEVMADASIYPDEIPNKIIGTDGILSEKISDDPENSKTYGDIIEYVETSDIAYLKDEQSTLVNEKYALSHPKQYPGYVNQLKGKVINGDIGDPFTATPTKSEKLKNADLRIDFIASNDGIGQSSGYDDNAYYIMYKTRLDSDSPMESVVNAGALTFATWKIGTDNVITWTGGDIESSKELEEVAKYNTIPKKEGEVKVITDSATNRQRLAAAWTITFNYDVDTRRVGDVPMVVVDTIDKNSEFDGYKLGNKHLVAQEIDSITLKKFSVDKDGKLTEVLEDEEIVTVASNELTITDSGTMIEYRIEKDLNPKFVYQFTINTLIETENAENIDASLEVSNIELTGKFTNEVSYTRGSQPGQTDLPDPGIAQAEATFDNINRVKKSGKHTSGNTKSNQEILWTVELNDTYENMNNLVITDKLESKHTFAYVNNSNDLENNVEGSAKLQSFKVQELKGSTWTTVSSNDYTLSNSQGLTDQPLDDWTTGESGFILSFKRTMSNPIRLQYATFGHVVDSKELPLKNLVNIEYQIDDALKNEHNIIAAATFRINDGPGGYEDERVDIDLMMRYNENQPAKVTEIDKGVSITGNEIDKSIVILYRYQDKFVQNNHIYRIGRPNADGKLSFKNVEVGNYIVKQFGTAHGYSVPNSLGYIDAGRNTNKDKSVVIDNSQLASGNLVTIDVKEESGKGFSLFADPILTSKTFAIFNNTPILNVDTKGKLLNANGSDASVSLPNVDVTVEEATNQSTMFKSDNNGSFKVGTVNIGDDRVDFGEFKLTQPDQELNGYLRNTETVTHNLLQNKNGTVDATTSNVSFNNYKTSAKLSTYKRGTTQLITNSTYTLEKYVNNEWVTYEATSLNKNTNVEYSTTNGIVTLHNLDVGQYRLKQKSIGGGYLLNTEALEFYVYGPNEIDATSEYSGKPPVMELSFENIQAQLNIKNIIGDDFISGSTFNIVDANDNLIETINISDAEEGYTTLIAPGNYTLIETGTSLDRPINDNHLNFTIEADEGVFEGETDSSIRSLIFENHLGNVDFVTHTPTGDTFDIETFTLEYKGLSLNPQRKSNLTSGSYDVVDVTIDSEWIHVLTDYTFEIPTHYSNVSELNKEVHVYGTKAVVGINNLDGDHLSDSTLLLNSEFKLSHNETDDVVMSNSSQTFNDVSPGTYTLAQLKAPEGYGLNTFEKTGILIPNTISKTDVVIDFTTHTINFLNLEDITYYNYRGVVDLTKLSGETQNALKGIEFDLYFEGQKLQEGLITNADGHIIVEDLSPGNYYFEEVAGDGLHIVNKGKQAFTIADSNENEYDIKELTIHNYFADVIFRNTNESGSEIYKDATFSLLRKEDTEWVLVDGFIDFKITPNTDYFNIFGISVGDYKLVQTAAPTGTVRNSYEYEFTIEDQTLEDVDGRITITLDDYINYKANLTVLLVDQDGSFHNEVNVNFVDDKGQELSIVQNGDHLESNDLGSGDYKMSVSSAQGAIVVDELLDIKIPESALNDEGLEIVETIRMTYATIELSLIDGHTKDMLSSGSFTINDTAHQIASTGALKVDHIGPGNHQYRQTVAAKGYILNTLNKGDFEVFETLSEFDERLIDDSEYPVVNLESLEFENYTGSLLIQKVNEDKVPLKGVEFSVSTKGSQVESVVTNHAGEANVQSLAPGHYVLKETKTLSGYEKLEDELSFDVVSEYPGEPEEVVILVTNKKMKNTTDPNTGIYRDTFILQLAIVFATILLLVLLGKKRKIREQ